MKKKSKKRPDKHTRSQALVKLMQWQDTMLHIYRVQNLLKALLNEEEKLREEIVRL